MPTYTVKHNHFRNGPHPKFETYEAARKECVAVYGYDVFIAACAEPFTHPIHYKVWMSERDFDLDDNGTWAVATIEEQRK